MQLGIYQLPHINDGDYYVEVAIYDFEAETWHPNSKGSIVSNFSENPEPREFYVRYRLDPSNSSHRIAPVDETESWETEIRRIDELEPTLTVEEGHQRREKEGRPPMTRVEVEILKNRNIELIGDDERLDEKEREFYEKRGKTIMRESEWGGLDYDEDLDVDWDEILPEELQQEVKDRLDEISK